MLLQLFKVSLLLLSVVGQQDDPLDALAENVPGVPGEDYPILSTPVETGFTCPQEVPGYYADQEGDCQLYHICAGAEGSLIKYDFLCPNGTLFDQQYFVCNWWFNVDCSQAPDFFYLNEEVLAAMKDVDAANSEANREGKSVTSLDSLRKRINN